MRPIVKLLSLRKLLALSAVLCCACGPADENSTPDLEYAALIGVKQDIADQLAIMREATVALQSHAPQPDDDGWNADQDADNLQAMKNEWKSVRIAYERIEGAIAVLFPDIDASTDGRYDGFIAEEPDLNLFDGEGVTGVHAIERILWSDSHPDHVTVFESELPNYAYPSFPTSEADAQAFKEQLVQRLIDDIDRMMADFEPLALDPAAAFRGVIGSMEEQLEKVNLAGTGEDESRYAQHTLADMRANLDGAEQTYSRFRAWIQSVENGQAIDKRIEAGFDRVRTKYSALTGDAIPQVPAHWNPEKPSDTDLRTPYGQLWSILATETDVSNSSSLVTAMLEAADLLNIAQLP